MTTYQITTNADWGDYVKPKFLRYTPIHRWLVFPHSFTPELVDDLINKWGLNSSDKILDPFVGAGTTLIAAQKAGIPSQGYDLSPFAVLASNVKTANYIANDLCKDWDTIKRRLSTPFKGPLKKEYPDLIRKAFAPNILLALEETRSQIIQRTSNNQSRAFFLLALLAIIPEISRAEATGGWLKWVEKEPSIDDLKTAFTDQVMLMLNDVQTLNDKELAKASSQITDARYLPETDPTYSAIITSPPYPNRHDYTRVFGVELMFEFLDWGQTRSLRYQSIHSHPEAKPMRPEVQGYVPPMGLQKSLEKIEKSAPKRIVKMLKGYFLDLFCCFKEMNRVALNDAKIAVVLGNAQYYGEPFHVDEYAAEIGEQVGLVCQKIVTARIRGNSAQQMKKYGRNPSRESVVIFNNKS